jgi:hypothetical protein
MIRLKTYYTTAFRREEKTGGDVLTGGFFGNGMTNMGDGNDTVKGFGTGYFDGGTGQEDRLLFGSGTYTVLDTTANLDGFYTVNNRTSDMFLKSFELIGSANNPAGANSFSSVIGGTFTVV